MKKKLGQNIILICGVVNAIAGTVGITYNLVKSVTEPTHHEYIEHRVKKDHPIFMDKSVALLPSETKHEKSAKAKNGYKTVVEDRIVKNSVLNAWLIGFAILLILGVGKIVFAIIRKRKNDN